MPEQRAPKSDAGSTEGEAESNIGRGGRLGNATTRAQNREIAAQLEDEGYEITGGGGSGKEEEYIPGEEGGTKGSTYVDITGENPVTHKKVRVQTVDTLADGKTPTPREQAAEARIRAKFPDDELRIIPKRKSP